MLSVEAEWSVGGGEPVQHAAIRNQRADFGQLMTDRTLVEFMLRYLMLDIHIKFIFSSEFKHIILFVFDINQSLSVRLCPPHLLLNFLLTTVRKLCSRSNDSMSNLWFNLKRKLAEKTSTNLIMGSSNRKVWIWPIPGSE